jgi:hypothetical protein
MNSIKSFIKEVFSMSERRVSTIILSLVAVLILSFYLYLTKGDIPETLLVITQTLIYIVGGVNGLNVVTKVFSSNSENKTNQPTE